MSGDGWEVRWSTGSGTDSRLLTSIDTGPVRSLVGAGADDEPVLVTAGSGSVAAWSVATGEVRWRHAGDGLDVLCVAPLGDGPAVLVGRGTATIRAFDLRTGEPAAVELDPSGAAVDQLRIADGGPPVAIGRTRDGAVPRWDLSTGRSLSALPTAGACFAVEVVDVDGRAVVATGHNQGYVVWDPVTGEELAGPFGGSGHVYGMAAIALGDRAAVAVANEYGVVNVVDLLTGEPLARPFTALKNRIPEAAGGLWYRDRAPVGLTRVEDIIGVPGRWQVHLWRPRQKGPVALPGGITAASSMTSVPWNGRSVLATASMADHNVTRVWDVRAPHRAGASTGHRHRVVGLAVSRDVGGDHQPVVAAIDQGGHVTWRDVADGGNPGAIATATQYQPNAVAVAIGTVYTGGGQTNWPERYIGAWRMSDGRQFDAYYGLPRMQIALGCLSIDGRTVLVTVGGYGEVKAIDTATHDVVFSWRSSTVELVTGGAFRHDGEPVVAASLQKSGMLHVWNADGTERHAVAGSPGEAVIAVSTVDGADVLVTGTRVEEGFFPEKPRRYATVRIRRLGAGPEVIELAAYATATSAAVSGPGGVVAVGYEDATLHLFDIRTGTPVARPMPLPLPPGTMEFLDGSRGLLVAFGGDIALLTRDRRGST